MSKDRKPARPAELDRASCRVPSTLLLADAGPEVVSLVSPGPQGLGGGEVEAREDSGPLPPGLVQHIRLSQEPSLLLKIETRWELASRKRLFGHFPSIEHFPCLSPKRF